VQYEWMVRKAAREGLTIVMLYRNARGEMRERKVDVVEYRRPYFRGYCHLRREYRTFRVDRIFRAQIVGPHSRSTTEPVPAAEDLAGGSSRTRAALAAKQAECHAVERDRGMEDFGCSVVITVLFALVTVVYYLIEIFAAALRGVRP